jgi:antitoxin HicB
MTKQNPHIGSTFESWLDEQGIREEVTAAAIKELIAEQLAAAMKEQGITKVDMAAWMKTSRAQVDRLLDPKTAAPRSKPSCGWRKLSAACYASNWCEG